VPSYSKARWPADGPIRVLLEYLNDLHRAAGRPSMSEIGDGIALSRNAVHDFLTGRRMINAGNLQLLVTFRDGDTAKAERLRKKAAGAWADERDTVGTDPPPRAGHDDRPWMIPPIEREPIRRPGPATALTSLLNGGSALSLACTA
jgi:hypothetical protein